MTAPHTPPDPDLPVGTAEAAASTPPGARHRRVRTPLGSYLIAAESGAVTGVWREEQSHFPSSDRLGEEAPSGDPLLDAAESQLLAYIAGERDGFDLPLAPRGTRSSSPSGLCCSRSRAARPPPTGSSPGSSGVPARPRRSARPSARTRSRSWSPAIACSPRAGP